MCIRDRRWAVVLSVIANWAFLEMNVINLASNYSAVYEGWSGGKAVYTILVVQNGIGSGALKTVLLTLITIAIFFATISTAINYAQGFNDRILNWYQKVKNEDPKISADVYKRQTGVSCSVSTRPERSATRCWRSSAA